MNHRIIQWNCRGIKANRNELLLLLMDLEPAIICLQETFLKTNDDIIIKNYKAYNYIHNTGHQASGGASILIRNDIPQSKINLNTDLQAVAIKATLHKTINICSLYIPPHEPIKEDKINNIIQQLPTPYILLGDFNSHNIIWGSKNTNQKGRTLENIINKNNLCLLNTESPTHLDPSSATYSIIDLTLCDPSIYLDFSWRVYEDTCGSDHFPIVIESAFPQEEDLPQWSLRRANWVEFRSLCVKYLTQNDTTYSADLFTQKLISIAKQCIPYNTTSHKQNRPWFSQKCREAIRLRRAALRKFNTEPTTPNLISFKHCRANARKIIKEAKRNSWQNYVSKLNTSTKLKTVWDMIRKIAGKKQTTPLKHLSVINKKITTKKAIADILAETFSQNSSTQNNQKFQRIKQYTEKKKINFSSKNSEDYNQLFTLPELVDSISKSHSTAVGPDEIHNEFLKNLPDESLRYLLNVFNTIWINNTFPDTWRETTIVPIPKTGKDTTNPQNYRPISLTSCLCKTMERIINSRLTWYLEKNNLITNLQTGFRKKRGTIDHLIRLETFIREAFIKKQHLTAIFFDLEKAYDTTWRYGIMKDLYDLGLRGRLPLFIKNFLLHRNFQSTCGIHSFQSPESRGRYSTRKHPVCHTLLHKNKQYH